MGATLAELARLVRGQVRGESEFVAERANSLERAGPRDISFFASGPRHASRLATTRAGAVILTDADAHRFSGNALIVENPPLAFAHICSHLHRSPLPVAGIHPSAIVNRDVRIAPTAIVDAAAVIDAGATVADGAWIGPGCVIGRNVSIGERSRLVAHVVVLDDCRIGSDCLLHPGAVIGADGFGFARDGSRWVKQPQLGCVIVGNNVEIGANTTIDRGTFADTVIGDGVKLDNLIQIAHNVRIGEHTAIAACVGIAGSSVIGKRCTIAGQAGIIDHIEIADDVHITAASVVTQSIAQPGVYSSSLKAEPVARWRRNIARLRQLDDFARRLRQLERQLTKEQP